MTNREAIYKVLMVIANRQGFILSPDIEDACIETELSLIDTDWVSSRIVQQNIPVLDEVPEKKHNIKKIEKSTPYEEVIETPQKNDVFEKHPSTKTSTIIPDGVYYCRGKGLSYEAQMEVRDGYNILLKGSRINHKQGPSLTKKLWRDTVKL